MASFVLIKYTKGVKVIKIIKCNNQINRNKYLYTNSVDLFIFVEGLEIISTFTENNYRQAFE